MIQNAEFILPGNRTGVLLIHGLTGTPNEMRIVGRGLNRAGFTVYGMQLAGHCGNEADLNQTTWEDWYKSVEEAAFKLKEQVDHVFVAGLSMGALLSLKLAAEHPEFVRGVGVYGVTFNYDGWSMPLWAKHLFFLLTWLKRFGLFQKTSFLEQPPYGLKDERIRATVAESMASGDSTQAGLAGNPFPATGGNAKTRSHRQERAAESSFAMRSCIPAMTISLTSIPMRKWLKATFPPQQNSFRWKTVTT